MEQFRKIDIAREYRIKYGAKMPTLTLARIMYNENIELFSSVDNARCVLRRLEGKMGDYQRKFTKDKSLFMTEERPKNPWKLPESEEAIYEPYIIKAKKIAVLSDVHVPYHSIDALSAALSKIQDEKPEVILLNGDTVDFYGLSRFMKDPRKRSVAHELKALNEFLDVLEQFGAKIVYKLGNHDERYQHYLMHKAPELLGIPEFEFEHLLKAKDRGMEVVGEKRIIKANKLNIIHGHEYPSVFSPVNIARGLYMKGKVSAMQGHNHQTSEHTESDMNGEIVTTWSLGCLCELNPAYMPLNKWSHGFAIVDLNDNGKDFHVRNYRIYKGKVL
jgi:predicted phosphodiesterase